MFNMTSGCVKKMYGTLFSVSPFSGRIRGGMRPGKKMIVMGIVNPEPDRYIGHTHIMSAYQMALFSLYSALLLIRSQVSFGRLSMTMLYQQWRPVVQLCPTCFEPHSFSKKINIYIIIFGLACFACYFVILQMPFQEGLRSLATDKITSNHVICTVADHVNILLSKS
uniref:Uncharacterized protein n=1 Tax=Salmo trutta TaxID=8032 RepID=A0A674DU26_SALTR